LVDYTDCLKLQAILTARLKEGYVGNRIKTRSLPQTLTLSVCSKEHGYRSKISNRIAHKVGLPEKPEGLDSERALQYYVGRTETSVDSNRKENKA